MTKSPLLLTERMSLHALRESDGSALLALCRNPDVYRTFMVPDLPDEESAAAFFEKMKELSESDFFLYGIYLGETLIGFLNECGREDGVEIGYVIAPAHWGHGYAPEAFRSAITELFRLGEKRVIAGYFEENPASRRVMEKCGLHPIEKVEELQYRNSTHRCFYMSIENDL